VQTEVPDHLLQCQRILAIPIRRHGQALVGYLSREYLSEILAQPDPQTRAGRRDTVLLSVLYDTGARVQELVDLSAEDVRLTSPAQVRLLGKGRKMRAVPLMDNTTQLLREHLREHRLDRPEYADRPLFTNRQNRRLTRWGVQYILKKHVDAVRRVHPGFTQPVTPHSFRHTKGMHLLQSGVSMDIIRDFLGHVDISTTQIYARANLEMKRKALDGVSATSPVQPIPSWKEDHSLLEWLHSL
ncbi:MAG: tyrosine-type recombinase/integrase, partial [Gammaproteobacteria bacterium]|nr:tyrosine-type recombinase/integrase [Gammaproteobacteria bacterium]